MTPFDLVGDVETPKLWGQDGKWVVVYAHKLEVELLGEQNTKGFVEKVSIARDSAGQIVTSPSIERCQAPANDNGKQMGTGLEEKVAVWIVCVVEQGLVRVGVENGFRKRLKPRFAILTVGDAVHSSLENVQASIGDRG